MLSQLPGGGQFPVKREPPVGPRLLATLVLGFLFFVMDTTVFSWWAIGPLRLQPILVLVVSAGFRLPLLWAGPLIFLLGYMGDLLSGGVVGLQITAYVVVLVTCAVAQRKLEISLWPFQMAAVGVMSLVFQLLVEGGLYLLDRSQVLAANLPWVLAVQALLSAFTAPIFFALLEGLVSLLSTMWPKEA